MPGPFTAKWTRYDVGGYIVIRLSIYITYKLGVIQGGWRDAIHAIPFVSLNIVTSDQNGWWLVWFSTHHTYFSKNYTLASTIYKR
ncbi:MAG: hypothetical protein L0Z71_18115 [Anaerolineae bacterium]|nr:hypothetical protein [Anaerolineae bacterium]